MSVRRVARFALAGSLSLAMVGIATQPAHASASDGGFRLTIVAGNGTTSGAPVAGPAKNTTIGNPGGVAFNKAGDMFIADYYGDEVLKVTPAGQLSIFAGTGSGGSPTVGPATSSQLGDVGGVATDAAGNVYIADYGNYLIEKVTPTGHLTIFAGNGSPGSPVAGAATSSPLDQIYGVATDAWGDVFIADNAGWVEKVTPAGHLSIFAGSGQQGRFAIPGPAVNSPMRPNAVTTDAAGNVYIADDNGYVEKVTRSGVLSVVAGIGYSNDPPAVGVAKRSPLDPGAVAVDKFGDLYVADWDYGYVEKITRAGRLSIIAGDGRWGNTTDKKLVAGPARDTALEPESVAVSPSGRVYYVDWNGYVATLVGTFKAGSAPRVSGTRRVGHTLRVSNVGTNVTPTTVSYQWLRNGVPIRGAHRSSYRLTSADFHKKIKVRVTYSAPSYTSLRQTVTAAVRVS